MKRLAISVSLSVCLLGGFASRVVAEEEISAEQAEFFEKKIRPVLASYCYECHSLSGGKTLGGLLLDTRESIREGGDSGPAVHPGSLDDSVLWEAINWDSYEMPPKEKLPDEVLADFRKWIEMGAPDPREREVFFVESKMDIEAGREHWAFKNPTSDGKQSIDDFVNAKLKEAELEPAPPADPYTLLRRLNFDLVGLPPTPGETKAFLRRWKVDAESAIEAKVDELLASPQYGERWARHWLDVARFAESSGKTNFSYPHAWRYRDFVIDAFNKDTPYDHFVRQQVAGDLLPAKTDEIWQENLLATGFLAIGLKSHSERNPRVFRMDLVDEQIDATSRAFLGLTVSCARCHDHKYDPIPIKDYYSLAGIFQSTKTYYGTVFGLQNHRSSQLLILPLQDENNPGQDYTAKEIAQMEADIASTRQWLRKRRADSENGGPEIVQREMVAARNRIGKLEGILATLDGDGQAITYGMGVQDLDEVVAARILKGGDVEKPAQEVDRGFLQVLDGFGAKEIPEDHSGRRELADWLSSKDNPLTARVMVNRIWLHLFGEGLVRSPNNWGLQGELPSHPELLDHLAVEFMENGWSVKQAIKSMVLTKAYQRSGEYDAKSFQEDSENRLLWRMVPRQLDAESLRDSMLAVSGQLDLERPYASEIAKLGDLRFGRQVDASDMGRDHMHRAVYLPIVRDQVHESLRIFDFADATIPVAKRDTTNVPSQSLYLMNSPFVVSAATEMAAELMNEHKSADAMIQAAFQRTYGRSPEADELAVSRKFLRQAAELTWEPVAAQQRGGANGPNARGNAGRGGANAPKGRGQRGGMNAMAGRSPGGRGGAGGRNRPSAPAMKTPTSAEQHALTLFCQSLMASAEFRILN